MLDVGVLHVVFRFKYLGHIVGDLKGGEDIERAESAGGETQYARWHIRSM